MEKVVTKLSEIEAAAVAIMDNANAKKKEISESMIIKTNEFDKTVDEETSKTLSDLNKKLELETEQELKALKDKTMQVLKALEDDYNKNHTALAKKILAQIIDE